LNKKCHTIEECSEIREDPSKINKATIITTENPIDYEELSGNKDHTGTGKYENYFCLNHLLQKFSFFLTKFIKYSKKYQFLYTI